MVGSQMRRFILIAVIALATIGLGNFPALAATEQLQKNTLHDLLQLAEIHNPEVQAARENWESQKARVTVARTWMDPMVEVQLEGIPTGQLPTPGNAATDMYMVTQQIPFPGKMSVMGRAQEATALQAGETYRETLFRVRRELTKTTNRIWHHHEAIRIHKRHLVMWEGFSRVAEARYSSGIGSQFEVLRAQIETEKIRTQIDNLEEEIPSLHAQLTALLGKPHEMDHSALETPSFDYGLEKLTDREHLIIEKSPMVQRMKYMVQQMEWEVLSKRLDFLPDFTVSAGTMVDVLGTSGLARLGLRIPLYFWKQTAEIGSTSSARDQAQGAYENAKNNVRAMFLESVAMAKNAKRNVTTLEDRILPRARAALSVTEKSYRAGMMEFLELLQMEWDLRMEELDLLEARMKLGNAKAMIEAVAGMSIDEMGGEKK